jgi:DNA-directed RNA polymerase II subunit RPB4
MDDLFVLFHDRMKDTLTTKHCHHHHDMRSALTTFRKETDEGQEIELHPFEVAALMNLMAADSKPDEALTLIPSLKRFNEAALDEILQMISDTMKRIND